MPDSTSHNARSVTDGIGTEESTVGREVVPMSDGNLTNEAARLAEFDRVCRQLWPYVRFFIIGGAHPDAIDAVMKLGRLLGHTEASPRTIAEIADKVKTEVIDEIAGRLPDMLKGKVISRAIPDIVDSIRRM